jgi:N-acyl-D-aspartate/D-glutamate deacylase
MTEAWKTIQGASFDERVAAMRDPSFRARLIAEERAIQERMVAGGRDRYASRYPLGDPPDYEPSPEDSVSARAAQAGVDPVDFLYDLLLSDEGRAFVYVPFLNYAGGNLDPVREMLAHPNTVPGLSDGGAHVGMICDGSFPTTLLTHWGRDRSRGDRLEVASLIAQQTRGTAEAVGFLDRGLLAPGMKADVNVIDFDGLTLHAPTMAFDLPAGGRRLLQRADGYLHTFVSGQEVYAGGEHTGALPGVLVRGAQSA